jgi:nucleoside-triphosphatase THEP1
LMLIDAAPPLAVVLSDDGADIDRVLTEAARTLAAAGRRPGGVVQANIARPDRRRCDMSLTDLWSGEAIAIFQDLGEESQACRLDASAFARACLRVEQALAAGAAMLIINRFGKQEAQGRGFRAVVAEALSAGAPVVMGVSPANLDACEAFAGGPVARLPADPQAVVAWLFARARSEKWEPVFGRNVR